MRSMTLEMQAWMKWLQSTTPHLAPLPASWLPEVLSSGMHEVSTHVGSCSLLLSTQSEGLHALFGPNCSTPLNSHPPLASSTACFPLAPLTALPSMSRATACACPLKCSSMQGSQASTTESVYTYCTCYPKRVNACVQDASPITPMQKLCLVKLVRPDCLVAAIQQYVIDSLGPHFGQPGPVSLASVRKDSNSTTPIIFVLSAGLSQLYLVALALAVSCGRACCQQSDECSLAWRAILQRFDCLVCMRLVAMHVRQNDRFSIASGCCWAISCLCCLIQSHQESVTAQ